MFIVFLLASYSHLAKSFYFLSVYFWGELTEVLYKRGKIAEAEETFKKAVMLYPEEEYYNNYKEILQEQNKIAPSHQNFLISYIEKNGGKLPTIREIKKQILEDIENNILPALARRSYQPYSGAGQAPDSKKVGQTFLNTFKEGSLEMFTSPNEPSKFVLDFPESNFISYGKIFVPQAKEDDTIAALEEVKQELTLEWVQSIIQSVVEEDKENLLSKYRFPKNAIGGVFNPKRPYHWIAAAGFGLGGKYISQLDGKKFHQSLTAEGRLGVTTVLGYRGGVTLSPQFTGSYTQAGPTENYHAGVALDLGLGGGARSDWAAFHLIAGGGADIYTHLSKPKTAAKLQIGGAFATVGDSLSLGIHYAMNPSGPAQVGNTHEVRGAVMVDVPKYARASLEGKTAISAIFIALAKALKNGGYETILDEPRKSKK